jgi:peptidoglycan/LPS O-acetylase OafA/YrhL
LETNSDHAVPSAVRSDRTAGLDTLRALAISLVFAYHYRAFVSHEATFGWASVVGWLGVDLFFVLSGYLIGNQIFAGIARGETLSLKGFYARRAFRTWPAFWAVLAAYFLFPASMDGKPVPSIWPFLTFTQNFGLHTGTAFSHAWSLCVEEQFYFALPLVVLVARHFGKRREQAWLLLGALLIVGIAARTWLWSLYGREESGHTDGYYPNIYYATSCRFDEFLPGIAVAMLKNFHTGSWQRIEQHGQLVLLAGLAATGTMFFIACHYFHIDGYGYGFFMTAFGYSLAAIAFSLLVVAALSPASSLHRIRIPGAYHLALWSYSIYLTQKAVAHVLSRYAEAASLSPLETVITISLACLIVGAALYQLIEVPFMTIRDRCFPSIFARWHAREDRARA